MTFQMMILTIKFYINVNRALLQHMKHTDIFPQKKIKEIVYKDLFIMAELNLTMTNKII